MKFRYSPHESASIECAHKQIRDLPDWAVECGDKKFTAHVIIREHHRDTEPKLAIEILYWVSEPSKKVGETATFNSSSFWIRLRSGAAANDKTEAHSMILSQGVENDYANLDLEWKRTE